MRNLWLREEDRKPEMTVVRNEFEIGENDPGQALEKEIYATAYMAHPYHHSTIGWRSDIEKVPIEKLKEFYDTFYWPDNATASVIGDFEPAQALAVDQETLRRDPESAEADSRHVHRGAGANRPAPRHGETRGRAGRGRDRAQDSRRLCTRTRPRSRVLNVILTVGKNSRGYRALTDKNLTTSVNGDVGFFHDPSLYLLYGNLAPGSTHEQVEKIVLDEVERVKKEGVTDGEVAAAIARMLAASSYARDGSFAIASKLNEFIAAGDWTLYVTADDALKKVTPAAVKRVANTYLVEDKRTTGWFIPNVPGQTADAKEAASPAPKKKS